MSISRFVFWLTLTLLAWLFPQLALADDPPPPAPDPTPTPAPQPAPAPPPPPPPEVQPPPSPAATTIATPPAMPAANSCLELAKNGSQAAEAIGALKFAIGDATQPLAEVRVVGLAGLSLGDIWQLVGFRPAGAVSAEQAAALIGRLAQTGLFARIAPTVRLSPDASAGAVLEIALTENAQVRAIEVHGLVELTRDEILDELLVLPDDDDYDSGDDDDVTIHVGKKLRFHRHKTAAVGLSCSAPIPPRGWLARHRHDEVYPGVVWRGLSAALERVQRYLRREGYLLGQVAATLGVDGTLRIHIDEGHLDSVTIEGVHPAIAPDVQRLLGLAPGAILNLDDVRQGLDRVRARYPFITTSDRSQRMPPPLAIAEQTGPDGATQYSFHPDLAACKADKDDDDDDDHPHCGAANTWYQLDGGHLTIHLTAQRGDADASGIELVRHTPVTGWAPGMLLSVRAWDPADRAHFRLDTLFNVNTSRANVAARGTGTLGELAGAQRIDFLVAPSLIIPRLRIAELGGALYTLTDTDDQFRVTRADSYLNSGLFGRPERDYFRRTGATAFATLHPSDTLVIGGEYRYDRYDSLTTASDPDTLIGDHIAINPAITDGIAGSVLLRAEWGTDKAGLYSVDAISDRRPSQGPIVNRPSSHRIANGLRSVATLEIADPKLGGSMKYWRAVSDSVLSLKTGDDSGVALRFRIGGGRDLPLQRQEALGGWGTLRGFDFKEFGAGDLSTLLSLEYRFDAIAAFVDAGALRSPTSDGREVHLGLGVALDLDDGQLAFAWRTDEQAKAAPEIRLLFGRPW